MSKKTIIYILILGILFFLILFYIIFYKDLEDIDKGEKFDFKIYSSPQKKIFFTMMLHTDGTGFNYYSYIYLIPGQYKKKEIPIEENYIKFPDGTGVIIKWDTENVVEILCDSKPIISKFVSRNFEIRIIIDRSYFNSLLESGKKGKFTRYKIN